MSSCGNSAWVRSMLRSRRARSYGMRRLPASLVIQLETPASASAVSAIAVCMAALGGGGTVSSGSTAGGAAEWMGVAAAAVGVASVAADASVATVSWLVMRPLSVQCIRAHDRPARIGFGGVGRVRAWSGGVAGIAIGRTAPSPPNHATRPPRGVRSRHRAVCRSRGCRQVFGLMGTKAMPSPRPPLPGSLQCSGGFVPNYRCGAVPEWRERVTGFPFHPDPLGVRNRPGPR